MATKIIKLNNGQTGNNAVTYVPITLADAVQYTYENGAMSVQQAIGTLAQSQISIADHLHDLQTISSDNEATNKAKITLSQNGGSVSIAGHAPNAATSTYAYVGLSTSGNVTTIKVSYTDTKPASANFSVSDGSTSKTAFGSNESTAKTLTIKGATGTPIETAVSQSGNTTTVDIKHKTSGVTAGTYGTNSLTSIGSGTTGNIVIPQYTVNSYGHLTASSDKTIQINIPDLGGLTGAMHWVGLSTTDPKGSSGATFSSHSTWTKGDVVTYNSKEYVLSGDSNAAANWLELGDEGSHAIKGTTTCAPGDGMTGTTMYAYVSGSNGSIDHAVPSGASAGKKDSTTNNFIKSVTTDKFGHVTAYTTGTFTNLSANTFGATNATNSEKTNGNVYLNHAEWDGSSYTYTSTHKITGTGIAKAYTDASGNLTIYAPAPTADIDIKTLQGGTNSTAYTAVAAGTGSATATANEDTIKLTGANYWINVNAASKNVNIAHALASGANKNTQGLYTVKIDNAGHSYSAIAQSSEAIAIPTGVDINAIGFTVGKEVELNDDWVNAALGNTQTPVNPSGSLTTTNTTHQYWYKVTS